MLRVGLVAILNVSTSDSEITRKDVQIADFVGKGKNLIRCMVGIADNASKLTSTVARKSEKRNKSGSY